MTYNTYIEKQFNIGELKGISAKTMEEHLKLYAGYVKHTNLILEKITELSEDTEKNLYTIGELKRRLGFEFGGMRNHEYYFAQFEGGVVVANPESNLYKKIEETWGSYEKWLGEFKTVAMTRGVGWAFLYLDVTTGNLINTWVGEQHEGHLTGLKPILALDMWEHSFMLDVPPSEKKKYVEAFFENVNFRVVEGRF
ncbi:superoxide dismutase [Arenimonas sp.]|nr:superoxide dismutase [Candidatus Parcubacteria bacterium]